MRHLILSIFLTLISLAATAKVYEDCDGITRFVSSEYRQIYNNSWTRPNGNESLYPKIGVSFTTNGDKISWSIDVRISARLPLRIYKGARMLILLRSGEIIELVNSSENVDEIGTLTDTGGGLATAIRNYTITASYEVEEQQIRHIIASGVSKIRIELPTTLHDEAYSSNDRFTEALQMGYLEVSEYLRLNPGDAKGMRDVYAGFVRPAATEENKETYDFMKAKASGAFLVRNRRGEETFYDPETKAYLTREEFLKKYEQWELDKLITLDK